MGEWSKSVGEKGEKIIDYFFRDILGYRSIMHNETIQCLKGPKHKLPTTKGERTTHGIDALVSMKSPVEDRVVDVGIISSKYTGNKYPNAPKGKFKEFLTDLAYTLECYKNSELSTQVNQNFSNVSRTDVIGILVWASNESATNENIISKIANIQVDANLIFDKIIVLDNNRLNFYVETIQAAKKEFGRDKVKFIYHNSGLNNISLQSSSYGDFLPLQYLFSDLLPLRVEKDGEIELVVFSKDEFSIENFASILDFAKSFDHLDSITSTVISFPDYNDLEHSASIKKELVKFGHYDYQRNLYLKSHNEDFRNY